MIYKAIVHLSIGATSSVPKILTQRSSNQKCIMEERCHGCAVSITDESDVVTCQGFCKATFHLKCSHLSASAWEEVRSNSLIYWMCPACRKLMSSTRFRGAINSTNDLLQAVMSQQNQLLDDLRGEIKRNTEKINEIVGKQQQQDLPNRSPWPAIQPRSSKRPRIQIDPPQIDEDAPRAICGSKEPDPALPIPVVQSVARESKFWLFLSRFSPHATVEEISNLVQRNLDMNEPVEVVKLVRRGVEINQLSFVSFKIGMGMKWKEKAMQPENWQKGIYFREFVGVERGPAIFRVERQRNQSNDFFSTPLAPPSRAAVAMQQ